jgi:hypothetical protein
MTEIDLIIDKELATDDEKNYNARKNFAHARIKTESGCYLARTSLQEAYEQG